MEFKEFAEIVHRNFSDIAKKDTELYTVDINPDLLWDVYLSSWPEGTNLIRVEKPEHDCHACKSFIRKLGGVVSIKKLENGHFKVLTVWDNVPYSENGYADVAQKMRDVICKAPINGVYRVSPKFKHVSVREEAYPYVTYNHFWATVPDKYCFDKPDAVKAPITSVHGVFRRGMEEFTQEAIDDILQLTIEEAYSRSGANLQALKSYKQLFEDYHKLPKGFQRDLYLWYNVNKHNAGLKNTMIGTAIEKYSAGADIDTVLNLLEGMAEGYKRPKAIVTPAQQRATVKAIEEGEYKDSLATRFATEADISVKHTLYVNRSVKTKLKDTMLEDAFGNNVVKPKSKKSIGQEISYEDFLDKVLPSASNLEVLLSNEHEQNFMTLLTQKVTGSKPITNWGHPVRWTYNGNNADALTQKVKERGGNVEGLIRVSLGWANGHDLDLHMVQPVHYFDDRKEVFHRNKKGITGFILDVDMNVSKERSPSTYSDTDPVENIYLPDTSKLLDGEYRFYVHNYTYRKAVNPGFDITMVIFDRVVKLRYDKDVQSNEVINVATMTVKNKRVESVTFYIPVVSESTAVKKIWNLDTQQFYPVKLVCLSPNYWGDKPSGNKHYFFILEGALAPSDVRGFFNEYLPAELEKHRRGFEILGDRFNPEPSMSQLSGLGFSVGKRANLVCKVQSGKVEKTYTVKW